MQQLSATITEGLGRLRQLALELRPPRLDKLGLVNALEHSASHAGGLAGFSAQVEDHLDAPVPAELQVLAYRFVQDAVANVRAHA